MMEKSYDSRAAEARGATIWDEAGAFKAGRPDRAAAQPFSIVIPPPNVTGNLHMGHALNNTLQDILARYWRMKGFDVLWQPGTDHAGIATQMVVERQLMERQEPSRREMGREKFLERVWEWKAESGGAIVNQLKRLGASCDWSRERFTMDEGLSKAVAKVFVQLHREGLIYKDKRLVNWDPQFQSAISDIEVVQVECKGSLKFTRGEGEFDPAALEKALKRNASGHLYYFDYPLEGVTYDAADPSTYITVATTRPETMLGDVAVAVHPDNEKLKGFIGKMLVLPLVGRRIPVVADDYADPEKGTGAVKITPAHDFNDFEVGKRHGLPVINILDEEANVSIEENRAFWAQTKFVEKFGSVDELMSEIGGYPDPAENYVRYSIADPDLDALRNLGGLNRFAARIAVVNMMATAGLLGKIEPHSHMVPHGDRSNVAIEPFLTDQWYVDAKTLAQPALAAVREGKTNFVPKNWEKTYFEWLDNIQPWCVSRQLWWGHQIPAWYGLGDDIFSAETEAEAIAAANVHYGKPIEVLAKSDAQLEILMKSTRDQNGLVSFVGGTVPLWRDEDVLDTWFSSALWPFSTMGWPDETPELKRFYPTTTLVTGFDIIFFWVARMMMMGVHFMKEVPFKDVYIHALVRDEKGAKMSKSKGNVIDPLTLIDKFGADSLRFTLAAMAAQGRDIKLSESRVEGYRNFTTKLWNAARFAEMNGCARVAGFDPQTVKLPLNRWILGECAKAVAETSAAIEAYRFNDSANAAYRFVWSLFCDWHLELAKPILQGEGAAAAKAETQATIAHVLDRIFALLHPFMPFVTEELWRIKGEVGPARASPLALAAWPEEDAGVDPAAEAEIGWVVDLIAEIRSARAEVGVPAAAQTPLLLVGVSAATQERATRAGDIIKRLARVETIAFADAAPAGALQIVVRGDLAALPIAGLVDVAAERARLTKEIAKDRAEIAKIDAKMANADFVAKAPEEIIEENKERRVAFVERAEKMEAARRRLEAIGG